MVWNRGNGFGTMFGDSTIQFSGPGFVSHYAEMPEGTLWIGTDGSGLWKMDLEADNLQPKRVFADQLGRTIYDLDVSHSGKLNIASTEGLFSISLDSLTDHSQTSGNSVFSLWSDSSERIWYGTEKGLYRFQNGSSKLIGFSSPSSNSRIVSVTGHPKEGVLALTKQALYTLQNDQLGY